MQVVFLGGASGIGASCLAIQTGDQWIVVDAGVRIGGLEDPLPNLAFLQDKVVAAVLVTHAHADHIGALPLLHAAFPSTPIYCTRATGLLMEVMLGDALRIMSKRANEEFDIPLYREEHVASTLEWLRPLPLNQPIHLPELPSVTLTATLAGHIAGAVCFSIDAPDGRLVISGDISVTVQRTVPGATIPPLARPDLLILESTYGRSALHANRQAEEIRLAETVTAVIARGGHCLVPSFSLGRAQEIILILNAAQGAQQIPRFPIYVDGLVRRIVNAYMQIPEALNPRLANAIRRGRLPFSSAMITQVRDLAHREQILAGPPACIISSSGMLTGGPSVWYAERIMSDEKAAILITGYVDEEANGYRLLALADTPGGTITLGGHAIPVHCTVQKYALSAHADASELAGFAAALQPAAVALVHGDPDARNALAKHLVNTTVLLPTEGDHVDVRAARKHRGGSKSIAEPLALVGLGEGRAPTEADLVSLHDVLRERDPDRTSCTTRELARLWYPTPSAENEVTMAEVMTLVPQCFMPVADLPGVYHLVGAQGVPPMDVTDLTGQLILARFGAAQIGPALCLEVTPVGLQIMTPRGNKGWRRLLPADVLEVLGRLATDIALDDAPTVLKDLEKQAQSWRKRMTRTDLLAVMEPGQSYSLTELAMAVRALPEDRSQQLAVAHMLNDTPCIVRGAAAFGEWGGPARYSRHPDLELSAAVSPRTTIAASGQANTAALNATVDGLFGDVADLYKRGFAPGTGAITLYFYFPQWAARQYAERIAQLADTTGVSVSLATNAHQGALADAARRVLPAGLHPARAASIHFETQTVLLPVSGDADHTAIAAAETQFRATTDWNLHIDLPTHTASNTSTRGDESTTQLLVSGPVNTAALNAIIDDLFGKSDDLYKRGFDSATGAITLYFHFPQWAARQYAERIVTLAEKAGVPVSIAPNAHQGALAEKAQALVAPGLHPVRAASIHLDEHTVVLPVVGEADPALIAAAETAFFAATDWRLQIIFPKTAMSSGGAASPVVPSSAPLTVFPSSPVFSPTPTIQHKTTPVVSSSDPDLMQLSHIYIPNALGVPRRYLLPTGELVLIADFPDAALRNLAQPLDDLRRVSGGSVTIKGTVNHIKLTQAARLAAPIAVRVTKSLSVYQTEKRVHLRYEGEASAGEWEDAARRFREQTGWELTWEARELPPVAPRDEGEPALDQARALAYVRSQLRPEQGLIKVGADDATHTIMLRFQFPDRVRVKLSLEAMALATGWTLAVHPHAYPPALEAAARALLPFGEGLFLRKSVLDPDRRIVTLTYHGVLTDPFKEQAQHLFTEQTGWQVLFVAVP